MNFWIQAFRKITSNEYSYVRSLREKPESYFQIGKKVRVINNLEYVKYIENKNGGGWTDEMKECLNEICTVINVDPDKMIQVKTTSGKTWLFKKDSLESINSEDEDTVVEKVPTKSNNQFNEDTVVEKVPTKSNNQFNENSLVEKEPSKLINQSKLFKAIENGNLINLNPQISKNILNKKNRDGMTPLFFACFIGKLDIVLWLCNKGADPKIPDKSGDLPIHNCAFNRNYEILGFLIERFPSTVNAKRKNGETLTDIAKILDDKNIENIIKKIIHKRSLSDNEIKPYLPEALLQSKNLILPSPKEIMDGSSSITKSINLPNPPEDGSCHNKIIPNLAKTFHQPKNSIHQSQKTIIGGSLYNRESISLLNPPEDHNVKLFENLKFENIQRKQCPSESISSIYEIIPEPPKDSIRKLPKAFIGVSINNSGIINLPNPPDDCNFKSCETLKFENIHKILLQSESISSNNEIIPEPPKTFHDPQDSIRKLQKTISFGTTYNSGIINLPLPPVDGSFKKLEILKFDSLKKKQCPSKSISDEDQIRNKIVNYFSKENCQILKEILNNPELQPTNEIVNFINDIITIFYHFYQREIVQNIEDVDEIILPMNCVFISINILSKLIENNLVTKPFCFSHLIGIFNGFSDLAESNALSERLCESILYAVCSNQKLSSIKNSISENEFINKLKKCFLNKRNSEEIVLASSVILINCYGKHENNINELHNELLNYLNEIFTKIDTINDGTYFGFTGKEIKDTISKMTENIGDLKTNQRIYNNNLDILSEK